MIQAIRKRMNQKGFTLVELMVVIAILGVLAAIAIPKFSESTAAANTAKIKADMRTIQSAVMMAQSAGKSDTEITTDKAYKDYLNDADNLKAPTGKYINASTGKATDIPDNASYAVTKNTTSGEFEVGCGTLKMSDLK